MENEVLRKGGTDWMNLGLSRTKDGTVIVVSVDPRIEEFFKSQGKGKFDGLDAYGKEWFSPDPVRPVQVYRMEKGDINQATYSFGAVNQPLIVVKTNQVNLSFLRAVGISGQPIRVGIGGPSSASFLDDIKVRILSEAKRFIQDYIVPVSINLRIYSTNDY